MTISNTSTMGPTPHTAHTPKTLHVHFPETFTGNGSESTTPTPDFHAPGTSRSQSDSARALECSLYESKHRGHREDVVTVEHGIGYLSKTDVRPEVKLKEASVSPKTQFSTLQLGILICLPTTLGVALAAGLRRLYT